jgi:hypothetical protein
VKRLSRYIPLAALMPAVASGQLSLGGGSVAQAQSVALAPWQATTRLTGSIRYDSPFSTVSGEGLLAVASRDPSGSLILRQQIFSPARAGLRLVAAMDFSRGPTPLSGQSPSTSGASSISYRRGSVGSWAGLRIGGGASAYHLGAWRQLAHWVNVSVATSMRRATLGARPPRFWTETHFDSVATDSGWVLRPVDRTFGDSGSLGRGLRWLETEMTLSARIRRIALDGVAGFRPPVDSAKGSTWLRATGTVAVATNVAFSIGAGTTVRTLPFTSATGRYGQVALRFAPAALLRPNETPEITPTATAFGIERVGDREYVVRVRLPRARTVELSGDFNNWQAIRLAREPDDSWTIALSLKPGTYRMNLRIDGEQWVPPPGTTAVDDEFNGKVGLVVVR